MRSEPDESDPFSFDGPEIMSCVGWAVAPTVDSRKECLFFIVSLFFFSSSKRCTIDWTKGKNVTLKTIKKKQKHKGRGTVRTVTKTVPNDSFFNFFTPPEGKRRLFNSLKVFFCVWWLHVSSFVVVCSSRKRRAGKCCSASSVHSSPRWCCCLECETLSACLQDEDSEAILAADFEIGHFIRERIVPRAVLYFTGEAIEDDDDDVSVLSDKTGSNVFKIKPHTFYFFSY